MSETIIHLVRHGHVENPERVFYGRLSGFPLSDEGRRQAAAAANALHDRPVEVVYSSPQLRARQTADIIREKMVPIPPLRIEPLLDEVRTPYDGVPHEEMAARNWDFYSGVAQQYEQPHDVLGRMLRFMSTVRQEHQGEQVVGVTHADGLAFLWMWVLDQPVSLENRRRLRAFGLADDYPSTASISTFTFDSEGAQERPRATYTKPY